MKKSVSLTVLLLASTFLVSPASAYPPPGDSVRITVRPDGSETAADSYHAVLSSDGRYIVFTSYDALLPEDTNGDHSDVYRKDLQTGKIDLVSVSTSGVVGESNSRWPSVSADGRMVVFESEANNLVPDDTNAMIDSFARDVDAGTTKRISVSATGTQADFHARFPEVSANGRFVSYISDSEALHPDDKNIYTDVFLHDLQTGSVDLISRGYQVGANALHASWAEVNGDGTVVAWSARSPMSDPPDVNGIYEDVFVTDRVAGTTERISDSPFGIQGETHSIYPSISDDGRIVAYQSGASNLVPNDLNGAQDVFAYDRVTKRTERISVGSDGQEGDFIASRPFVSGNGRYVAFVTGASNLASGDDNGQSDVFVHDRVTRTSELVSTTPSGDTPNGLSLQASVSGDGQLAAFMSRADDIIADDTNGYQDIFVYRRGPSIGAGRASVRGSGDGFEVEGWARFGGVVLGQATDFSGDSVPPGHADLIGARVVHRPEEEDLLVEVDLAPLPDLTVRDVGLAGPPSISYSFSLSSGPVSHQVRVTPAPNEAPTAPTFILSRCAPTCTTVGPVPGTFGGLDDGFLFTIPLSALTGVTQISGMGVSSNQQVGTIGRTADSISLGGGSIGSLSVTLGTAAPGASEEQVSFTHAASLQNGRFAGSIPGSAGARDVWVRSCIGTACGASKLAAI